MMGSLAEGGSNRVSRKDLDGQGLL